MPKWRALHPYRPYRAARTFVSPVARDRTEGTGGKVEPHAHDKNADDDDDRDGPIIVQEGPSSGALDTTLEKKKKEQEAAADEKRKSQITEAEEDEHEGMHGARWREHEEVTKEENVKMAELGRATRPPTRSTATATCTRSS